MAIANNKNNKKAPPTQPSTRSQLDAEYSRQVDYLSRQPTNNKKK